uniref:Leucine-rich repeat-containing N-terminal plant-type domain-containing protein n=1 Tax=Oryza barthii TaxID=65489 RepID=A0A0D3HCR5_9ORYZ
MNKLSLALASYLILFLAAAATAATARCTFEIVVKTDGRRNAGTDARVSLQASRPEGRRSVGRARRTLHEVGRGGGVVVAGRAVSAQFATAGADLSSGAAAAASAAGRRCTSPTSHRARARSGCAPSSPGSGSSRAAVQLRRVSRGCALFVYRAAEGASSTPTPPEEQTTRAAAAAVASPLPALNLTNRGLIGQMSPLGNLTFLKFLFVPANSFTGEIPQSFGNMHHLQIIYLSNNTLQRRMPNLAICSNLKVLWLNGNNLVGQIPADLPQRFQSLQLSVNNLTGPIPVSVANITTLKRFSCLYNNIDGSIPNDFAKLPGLVYLHLGANKLAANIPNLIALELGGNLFTNVIPRSGGGMRGLLFQTG